MAKVEITYPGTVITDEFTALVAQPTTPAAAKPVDVGLVEISTPSELIPGPPGPPGPGVSVSDTPPANPVDGDLWWESDTGLLWAWYVDADSGQWVQISGGTGAADDGIMVTAKGGTEARSLTDHFGDTLNAKDFGAKGDNVADDTAALNAFFAAIRSARTTAVASVGTTVRALIPPGVYRCGNVNATDIRALNWVLECSGAILNGVVAGKPVLDMIGSRFFTIKDLMIVGDATNKPTFGLQHGIQALGDTRGEISFLRCKISGYFSKACYVNLGSETVSLLHPTFFNYAVDAGSYVAALDGQNTMGIVSDFAPITVPPNTFVGTFIQTTWISCDLRKMTSGKCFLITGNVSQHHFYNSYMVSFDDAAIFITKATAIRQLHFEVHFEAGPRVGPPATTGITTGLLIDNTTSGTNVVLTDIYLKDHAPQCINSIINLTGPTGVGGPQFTVTFDGCEVHVGSTPTNIPVIGAGASAFGTPNGFAKFLFSGKISWHRISLGTVDLSNMIFNGDVEMLDTSSSSIIHGYGAYRIIRRPSTPGDRLFEFKGPIRSAGRTDATTVDNYIEMSGSIAGSPTTITAGGTDTNVNIDLTPKGSGIVRTGALTLTGDASITKATPSLVIDKAVSGENGSVSFKTAGLLRWNLQSESTAESAGSGSNFALKRYDDAGAIIELALLVSRASGNFLVARSSQAHFGTAIPAGGTAGAGFLLSNTANFGVFFGSGAPSLFAAKGSLYLRSDGTTTNDRMYVNTNGSTTWTAVNTVA